MSVCADCGAKYVPRGGLPGVEDVVHRPGCRFEVPVRSIDQLAEETLALWREATADTSLLPDGEPANPVLDGEEWAMRITELLRDVTAYLKERDS